jgi:PAS domain S-box-containing protein
MDAARSEGPSLSRTLFPGRTEIALLVVFALLAAGIALIGYFSFLRYESNNRLRVESQLEAITDLKIAELENFRMERYADGELLHNNGNISTLVRRYVRDPRNAEARMGLEEWFGKFISSGSYDRAVLLDADGVVRLTARGPLLPVPEPVLQAVREVFHLGEPMLLDFYRDERERKVFLELLIPFFEKVGSRVPQGVIALRINPEISLYPAITHWPGTGRSAETLLVRKDGGDVVFLNKLKSLEPPPLSVRIPLDAERRMPAVQAALGREGIMEGTDYRGVPVLAHLRSVPHSPWRLVARMDLSEVNAPVRERLFLTISLACVLLLGAAAGVGLLWRRQRARFYKEQYEAEREKGWLRDVLSRSLNEIYVFDPRTLRFRYVNAGGLKNLGYGMEELSGMTPVDIKPRLTEAAFRDMIRPLEDGERSLLVFESVHRRKNGTEYPVEVHLQLVPSVDGAVFLAIINDITERKAAEDLLRGANQRLRFHVDRMPLAYIEWDGEFRVREWNPAAERIFGWNAAEALGMHGHEIVPPDARALLDGEWSRLRESGEAGYSLHTNVRKDGKAITCEWFNTPLRDAEGNVIGMLSMVHDVTEKTELERKLQTAQRMEAVGTLAGGIAHDFNNALTGIIGFAEMLKARLQDNPHAQADIDQILRSAERASLLTRQILTFARRQVIALSNISLNRVVGDVMELVSKVVGAHIEIRTSLAENLPTVRADAGQIEQVIMNLVLNARDAMPAGGRLLIGTGLENVDAGYVRPHPYMEPGAYVVLTVSDTGIGMDRATRERVFEPFFTTKGPEKGTGLGLAMVYGIVKQHKGFIHLYSEPGQGTTFRIFLPPVDALPDAAVPAEPPECRGGTETILLAEDDESVCKLVERTLAGLGYTVLVARDGREAVETFRRNRERVGLAILDVVMPRLGGKGAFEELRREKPDLKVIFMSGYVPDAGTDSFPPVDGVPFLQKPAGPGVLARKVREVLDGK